MENSRSGFRSIFFRSAAALIRRAKPEVTRGQGLSTIGQAIVSWNGLFAGIAAAGAAFAAWQASCNSNPTWAAAWPDVPVTLVAIAGAAAGAATVPLGL